MTNVKFYLEKNNIHSDVFAYFPNLISDRKGNVTSYSHVGQHSGCSKDYIKGKRLASPLQYDSLLKELVSLGYDDLNVINKRRKNNI